MKAILFDLDGVFYQGNKPIADAIKIIDWVDQNNIPYLFVTNTTSAPRTELVNKLASMNIITTAEYIFTPLVAAQLWLQSHAIKNIALYIPESSKSEFAGFSQSYENPDAIIVGDLGYQWNYEILNHIFRLLMDKSDLPLLALGMTRYWQAEDGLRLDVAPFIKALEHATNREAIVMGKPAATFFQSALTRLQFSADEVLMIGDDIRGDIEGAQQSGLKTALVRTGKFRESDLQLGIKPDYLLDSVVNLAEQW